MTPRWLWTLVIVAAMPAASAEAQDDGARARALFGEGIAAYDGGDATEAERLFRESIALRRSGSALFNLATLLEREQGDLVEALHLYEEVAAMTDVPAEIIDYSRDRMADLAPRLAELVQQTGEAPSSSGSTPPPAAITTPPPSGPDLVGPAIPLSVGGATLAAAVVTGSVATVIHSSLGEDCPGDADCQDRIDTGRALALVTDVLFAVGGAAAGAGLIWLIVALTEGADDASDAASCGTHGCGARLRF